MAASFYVMEFCCYAFTIWAFIDAYRRGARWVSTLIAAILFGLGAELFFLFTERDSSGSHYTYGNFCVMVGWAEVKVPLWVGTGWGYIVYASLWTADRLALPISAKTAAAGLLAVNIDFSLDPVAELLGFWSWHNVPRESYFDVPFDNFAGWLMIVGSYTAASAFLFARVPERIRGKEYWVPFAALVPALLVTALGQIALNYAYGIAGQQALPFSVLALVAVAVAYHFGRFVRRDHPANLCILAMPLFFHTLLLAFVVATGEYRDHASLLLVIPMNLAIGFFGFAWASLDRIAPGTARPA